MSRFGGKKSAVSRRKFAAGAIAAGGGLLLAGGVSAILLRHQRASTLTLLGSGGKLSVLISSGGARLLILNGTDPADFGNALRGALTPLLNRIDIVIVADQNAGSGFVRSALSQVEYERLYLVGDPDLLLDAGVPVRDTIRTPIEFQLPGSTTFAFQLDARREGWEPGWNASLTMDGRHVVVTTGLHRLEPGSLTGAISAWIHLDDDVPDTDLVREIRPASIHLPAAAVSGSEFEEQFPDEPGWTPIRHRIHAGDMVEVDLSLPAPPEATISAMSQESAGNPQSGQ